MICVRACLSKKLITLLGRFVVGTEEQSPFHKAHNRIFFSQLDEHNRIRLDANGIPFLWSHPVNEVRSFPPAAFFFFLFSHIVLDVPPSKKFYCYV